MTSRKLAIYEFRVCLLLSYLHYISSAQLKIHYTEDLCSGWTHKTLQLKNGFSAILTSVPSKVDSRECTIQLNPEAGHSVVLSVYKFNLSPEDQLTITNYDKIQVTLTGKGSFPDERKSFTSKRALFINYLWNITQIQGKRVKFQFILTLVHDAPCRSDEFQCKNKKCIPKELVCDRHNHCGDNSDQENCEQGKDAKLEKERSNEVKSGSKKYENSGSYMINNQRVVNKCRMFVMMYGEHHGTIGGPGPCYRVIYTNPDEEGNAYIPCKSGEFQCRNRKCIPERWVCDKRNQCGDSSDEENCDYWDELCKGRSEKILYLENINSGSINLYHPGFAAGDCTIRLMPRSGSSVVLSLYRYHLSSEEQLTITDSDDFHVALLGRGFYSNSRQSFISNGEMVIRYTWNLTEPIESYFRLQAVFTQANNGPCSSDEFPCRNQKCIAKHLVCDKTNNCGDRSEEEHCSFWGTLCKGETEKIVYLKYLNSRRLDLYRPSIAQGECTIRLVPESGSSVVLSELTYHLSSEEQLTITDSDDFKYTLHGEGLYTDSRESLISNGDMVIHYAWNVTEPMDNYFLQSVFTQANRKNNIATRSVDKEKATYATPVWIIVMIVCSVILMIVIVVFIVLIIRSNRRIKKQLASKTASQTVASTQLTTVAAPTPPNPSAPSLFGRFRQSLKDMKTSRPAPLAEEPKSDNCQVPTMYPQVHSNSHFALLQNPEFKVDKA